MLMFSHPRPFVMQDFLRFKNGPFHRRQKSIILCDSKRSSSVTYEVFFYFQFDKATLIIPSFRMIKARGCKLRFKSDLVRIRGTKYSSSHSSTHYIPW